jgi:hypothetical protein
MMTTRTALSSIADRYIGATMMVSHRFSEQGNASMSWALRISCVTMHGKYVDMRHPCNKQSSTLRARTSSSFRLFHILSIRLAKMHSISATPTKLRANVRRIALITVLLHKCLCRSKCTAELEAQEFNFKPFQMKPIFFALDLP